MPKKRLCLHTTFSLNRCENPWTGATGETTAAKPFHDLAEKYIHLAAGPNACAQTGETKKNCITNNYFLNFSVSPFLINHIKTDFPLLYSSIIKAHKESHSANALAACFCDRITPANSEEEKALQIIWGLYAFEQVFGHKAQGFDLTADIVDESVLELLCERNISFALISETQAVNPKKEPVYFWKSQKTGKTLTVFAAKKLKDNASVLNSGEELTVIKIDPLKTSAQQTATLYSKILEKNETSVCTFWEVLQNARPKEELQLTAPNTEPDKRFSGVCKALKFVQEKCGETFALHAPTLLADPMLAARNYITTFTEDREKDLELFFGWNAKNELSDSEKIKAVKLLELKRLSFFMAAPQDENSETLKYKLCCAEAALDILRELGASYKEVYKNTLESLNSPFEGYKNLKEYAQEETETLRTGAFRAAANYCLLIKPGKGPQFSFASAYSVMCGESERLALNAEAFSIETKNAFTTEKIFFTAITVENGNKDFCALYKSGEPNTHKEIVEKIIKLIRNDVLSTGILEENGFVLFDKTAVAKEYRCAVIGHETTAGEIARRKFLRQLKNAIEEGHMWNETVLDALGALFTAGEDVPYLYELRRLASVRFIWAMEKKSAKALREILKWISFFETHLGIPFDWQARLVLEDFASAEKENMDADFNAELEFLAGRYLGTPAFNS